VRFICASLGSPPVGGWQLVSAVHTTTRSDLRVDPGQGREAMACSTDFLRWMVRPAVGSGGRAVSLTRQRAIWECQFRELPSDLAPSMTLRVRIKVDDAGF